MAELNRRVRTWAGISAGAATPLYLWLAYSLRTEVLFALALVSIAFFMASLSYALLFKPDNLQHLASTKGHELFAPMIFFVTLLAIVCVAVMTFAPR